MMCDVQDGWIIYSPRAPLEQCLYTVLITGQPARRMLGTAGKTGHIMGGS